MLKQRTGSRMTAGAVLGLAGTVMALTACTTPSAPIDVADPNKTRSTGSTDLSTSTAVAEPLASASPNAEPMDAEPTPEATVEGDTLSLATAAVTAFCRPGLDHQNWINGLYPFLTQQAAIAYETVDPANVPCTALTGPATVRDGDGAFTARVLVPTDAGEYSVYVHRTAATAPWGIEQITPLASE